MEDEVSLDPIDFLKELYARDLPYLLVGRQALVLLGAPLLSADYDFYFSPEPEHLGELLGLARERELEIPREDLREKPFFSLLSDNLKLDFFRCRAYTAKDGDAFTFDELFARKKIIPAGDFAIYVPSIRDLIRSKRVRNSPKDREDIKYLQILDEREGSD